jgi:hypothetical protein
VGLTESSSQVQKDTNRPLHPAPFSGKFIFDKESRTGYKVKMIFYEVTHDSGKVLENLKRIKSNLILHIPH